MNIAIIAAAGDSRRFSGRDDKIFIDLLDKPLIFYSAAAMEAAKLVDEVVLVVAADKVKFCQTQVVERFGFKKIAGVISGGNYRQESVYFGLRSLPADTNKVVVHDGGRPLVKPEKIDEVVRACSDGVGAILAAPVTNTIKRVEKSLIITETLDRNSLWQAQTPQVFNYNKLLEAHEWARKNKFVGTDDAALLEATRQPVKVIDGDYDNIKITTRDDLITVKALLLERMGAK